MTACIYARTCYAERRFTTTEIPNQVAYARDLARDHGLNVPDTFVFTDHDLAGGLLPDCWESDASKETRPALSAMIDAIQAGAVTHVIVRRPEKLGNSSWILENLRELFETFSVCVILGQDVLCDDDNPGGRFALSILRPCLQVGTAADQEKIEKQRTRKREEIERLHKRIDRLEAELAQLDDTGLLCG